MTPVAWFIAGLMSVSSVISAITIIVNAIKNGRDGSKTAIDKYIQKQITPSLTKIDEKIDQMNDHLTSYEIKDLRYKCLCFASDIRRGVAKTRQEYEDIFRMEDDYNILIEKNGMHNGYLHEEMSYVHRQYQKLIDIIK